MKRLAMALLALSLPAEAATVEVTVKNVRNAHGNVLVAICTRADFLQPRCPYRGRAAAREGAVQVSIAGVPPGVYAAQAFHDENGNGRLDRNFLGLPLEGMGFSNDAKMHMGPPRFEDASFTVGEKPVSIAFDLVYR